MKKIVLLGSTGSIGTQCLEVIDRNRDRFSCSALCCGSNLPLLRKQIGAFSPEAVSVASAEDAETLRTEYPGLKVYSGDEGLRECAAMESDLVINALVGIRGLVPTLTAIEQGRNIALANKETLVTGGELVMKNAREKGVSILPIDSEHSAVFQCLQGAGDNGIKEILLTASGGPFRGMNREQMSRVTLADALRHPNWSMGKKITVDSATLMNKGFEVMEAVHLFGVAPDQVTVLVHPQSLVHSGVRFEDGAVIAQLGTADMRLPISFALAYPDRLDNGFPELDLFDAPAITFEKPDTEAFPCLGLAFEALRRGGTWPAALNGANEVLVSAFLKEKIRFLDIPDTLEKVMDNPDFAPDATLDSILETDRQARRLAKEIISL